MPPAGRVKTARSNLQLLLETVEETQFVPLATMSFGLVPKPRRFCMMRTETSFSASPAFGLSVRA
jgi:hypothetical protein